MSTKKIILLVSLILLPLVGYALWHNRPVPAELRLDLNGTAGMPVAGTVVVDGVTQDFGGTLPTNITVRARSFDYLIRMTKRGGTLNCRLGVSGAPPVCTSTTDDLGGLQGHYSHRWGGKTLSMTTMNR